MLPAVDRCGCRSVMLAGSRSRCPATRTIGRVAVRVDLMHAGSEQTAPAVAVRKKSSRTVRRSSYLPVNLRQSEPCCSDVSFYLYNIHVLAVRDGEPKYTVAVRRFTAFSTHIPLLHRNPVPLCKSYFSDSSSPRSCLTGTATCGNPGWSGSRPGLILSWQWPIS